MSEKTQAKHYADRKFQHIKSAREAYNKATLLTLGLKLKEINLTVQITNERDDNGKPVFSNETMRSAELMKRCREDVDYCQDEANRDKHQEDAKIHQAEADYYRDLMEIELAFAGLGSKSNV